MREIKFRVWNKVDGHMVEPDQLYDPYIFRDSEYHVLMQYTGLKDKNGVEIYEGDIVCRYWNDGTPKNLFPIKWQEDKAGWNISQPLLDAQSHSPSGHWAHGFEVIGNIYENPELIK